MNAANTMNALQPNPAWGMFYRTNGLLLQLLEGVHQRGWRRGKSEQLCFLKILTNC